MQTPRGSAVDNSGCPKWESALNHQENTIYFAVDSAETNNHKAQETIQKIAETTLNTPESSILLTGYASQPASDTYNLKLSRKRAENIQQQLTNNFGIDSKRIKLRWRGEKNPARKESSPEANQANRRVNALITFEQSRPIKKWSALTFPQPVFQ